MDRLGDLGSGANTSDALAQPIGFAVADWTPRPRPARTPMQGRRCRVEPLDVERHAADLHAANGLDVSGRMWTYLSMGPFADLDAYRGWLTHLPASEDPLFFAIVDSASERAVGLASYLRMDPANGVIEVGNLQFSPLLQRTPLATEAMFLMMQRVFDELGYRRYEWKTDSLNASSRAAAARFGFTFEGIYRQAVIYKARNRDTAWFSMLDREWPRIRPAFERWLDPANFDAHGRQHVRLSELTATTAALLPGLPVDD
ncbi:MAG: GNAT family N-acetyltransferase [Chloroflexota bacterium]